jgi:hypothetical protein
MHYGLFVMIAFSALNAVFNLRNNFQQVKKYNFLLILLLIVSLVILYGPAADRNLADLPMMASLSGCCFLLTGDLIQYLKNKENKEVLEQAAVDGFENAGFVLIMLVVKLLFMK